MAQKGRTSQNNQSPQSTGGNVLFTLGMVSVVALLIIGYVLTQGGMDNLKEKVDTVINLKPTQAATPAPIATPAAASVADVVQVYEQKLKKQSNEFAKQLAQQKRTYETQLSDLKMQIQILKDENKRLRGEK